MREREKAALLCSRKQPRILMTKDTGCGSTTVLRGLKHLMAGPGVKHGRRVTLSVPMAGP